MAEKERPLTRKRWVIKIGSALLTHNGQRLAIDSMEQWVSQLDMLRKQNVDVVLVSSGAVAAGMECLGWKKRPEALRELQACAAIGQARLVQAWERCFHGHNIQPAQILLTHADHNHRQRYLNAKGTLNTLLSLGVVPVVNENDTVVTDEIRFGDNDTLGALVAHLTEADCLVILTDQDGLFTADPRKYPEATLISSAKAVDSSLDEMAGDSRGNLGRGGMQTKLRAARLAACSGTETVIANGSLSNLLPRLLAGESIGTHLMPERERMAARKLWLKGHLRTSGKLVLDDGAVQVLKSGGKSLLPVGVKKVSGYFQRGAMVMCVDEKDNEIARGLVNYSSVEARNLLGYSSRQIFNLLGYVAEPELIHRDNLVIVE
ncbi:Glutamate 5-kinase [invertebrate metagenome]|uniref:Glutamate 5-kinase n=1 Tax=invertebrate metagenome TaxID=1711999 RepID=A0A2H9TA79_9ZZZZ